MIKPHFLILNSCAVLINYNNEYSLPFGVDKKKPILSTIAHTAVQALHFRHNLVFLSLAPVPSMPAIFLINIRINRHSCIKYIVLPRYIIFRYSSNWSKSFTTDLNS